jgi:hypothetical protein
VHRLLLAVSAAQAEDVEKMKMELLHRCRARVR